MIEPNGGSATTIGRGALSRRHVLAGAAGAALAAVAGATWGRAQSAISTPAGGTPGAGGPTKLDLNAATEAQFRTVPGVGDRMVREFLEYRPYTTIVQFRQEIGKYVPEDQVAAYEQYVYVPVDPNKADAETLKQIPGVTDDVAKQLIAKRPFASEAAFLAELGAHLTPEQVTAAKVYLPSVSAATPAAGAAGTATS